MAASIDALKNAAILKNSTSLANMTDDPFAMPDPHENPRGRAYIEGLQDEAHGTSPALRALSAAADRQRLLHGEDQAAEDADLSAHGMSRATTRAGVENTYGDLMGEGAARRQFLPFEAQANARDAAAKQALATTQYVTGPATVANQTAQGVVGAAEAHAAPEMAKVQNIRIAALMNALAKRYGVPDASQKGALPAAQDLEKEIAAMEKMFGLIKPGMGASAGGGVPR